MISLFVGGEVRWRARKAKVYTAMMTIFVRGSLTRARCLALTVAVVMPAGNALAEPIPIKTSLLKWAGSPPVGKLYKMVSKADASPFQLPNCQTNNPVALGWSLTVTMGDKQLTCDLVSGSSWKVLGTCADPGNTHKGYKYVNKQYSESNPCKVVIVKEKVIKVLAKGVGNLDPPGPQGENPEVEAWLDVGNHRYCALGAPEHFKEKENSLIKIKDQPVPPVKCGNNCAQAGEQCDGTEDVLCPGICQSNCRCPEPLCGNGVLEVGEDCEPPCSEDPPCGGGTICGADCTCVPNAPCNCGTSEPTLLEFVGKVKTGICGNVKDSEGIILTYLECATSHLGAGVLGAFAIGGTGVPLGTSLLNVECCYGTTLVLGNTTEAETGDFKTCTSAGCGFGGPVPVIATPAIISVCTPDTLYADSFGFMDCLSGEGTIHMPVEGVVYVTGDGLPRRCSDDTPDGNKGCLCTDDSDCAPGTCLWDYPDHCDSNSPNPGAFCTSDAQCAPGTCVDETHREPCPICNPDTLKCNGGPNDGMDCTPQGDLIGFGYPTSQDCPPPSQLRICPTYLPYPLKTQMTVLQADDGQFCGYCRDVEGEGSLCFEGDPDLWTGPGQQSCPDSSVIPDCKPATYHSDPPVGGNPDDIAGCGQLATIKCNSDADCYAPYETCQQRAPGAFDEAAARTITMWGEAAGNLSDRLVHDAILSGAFCTSAAFSPADPGAGLPGPGAVSFPAELRLRPYSPSGAFLDVTNGIPD